MIKIFAVALNQHDHNTYDGVWHNERSRHTRFKHNLPLNRGDTHLIKAFSSYSNSVESYFDNINSHYAYEDFRDIRNIMRKRNNFSNVNLLVNKLSTYAEDENYIKTIRQVIKTNNFAIFDQKTISY